MGNELIDVIIACDDAYGLDVHTIIGEINKRNAGRSGSRYRIGGFICDDIACLDGFSLPALLLGRIADWVPDGSTLYAMGIRDPMRKETVAAALENKGAVFETFIAPWTLMPDEFEVGRGCVIANYNFKRGSKFSNYVTIDSAMCESVTVGEYSTLCAFANITNATIGRGVYVGSHVAIMPGKKVGDHSWIETGSVIVANIKPGSIVAGVPVRRVRVEKRPQALLGDN